MQREKDNGQVRKLWQTLKGLHKIADCKYPNDKHAIVWLFDYSSSHRACAEDALNTKVKPDGAQLGMQDTMRAVIDDGTPKRTKHVSLRHVSERGHSHPRMMIGKSEKSIRLWKAKFLEIGIQVPESKKGPVPENKCTLEP